MLHWPITLTLNSGKTRSQSLYFNIFNIIHPNKEVLYNASDSDNPDKIAIRKLNALYNQIFTFAPPTLIVF